MQFSKYPENTTHAGLMPEGALRGEGECDKWAPLARDLPSSASSTPGRYLTAQVFRDCLAEVLTNDLL